VSKILTPGQQQGPSGIVGPDGKPVERSRSRVIALLARPKGVQSHAGDGKTLKLQFGVDMDFGVICMDGHQRGPLGVYGGLVSIIALGIPFDECEDFFTAMDAAREKFRHEKALKAEGKPPTERKN